MPPGSASCVDTKLRTDGAVWAVHGERSGDLHSGNGLVVLPVALRDRAGLDFRNSFLVLEEQRHSTRSPGLFPGLSLLDDFRAVLGFLVVSFRQRDWQASLPELLSS